MKAVGLHARCLLMLAFPHGKPVGGLPDITAADPVKAMNEAMEESSDWMNTFVGVVSSLFAPEEEDEGIYSSLSVLSVT